MRRLPLLTATPSSPPMTLGTFSWAPALNLRSKTRQKEELSVDLMESLGQRRGPEEQRHQSRWQELPAGIGDRGLQGPWGRGERVTGSSWELT